MARVLYDVSNTRLKYADVSEIRVWIQPLKLTLVKLTYPGQPPKIPCLFHYYSLLFTTVPALEEWVSFAVSITEGIMKPFAGKNCFDVYRD